MLVQSEMVQNRLFEVPDSPQWYGPFTNVSALNSCQPQPRDCPLPLQYRVNSVAINAMMPRNCLLTRALELEPVRVGGAGTNYNLFLWTPTLN